MTTWHVRPSGGDYGAEDGTSYDTAWDGFSNIDWTASGVQPGDILRVYGEHRELLTIGGSGASPSSIITIRGDGDVVGTINGSELKDNASFSLTAAQTNTYEIAHTLGANLIAMVWEGGVRLTAQASIANVEANPGSFWQDTSILYIHPTDSSSVITNGQVYEVPSLLHCIDWNGNDYVQVKSVDIYKTYGSDGSSYGGAKISGTGSSYVDSSSYNHRRHCVQIISPALSTYCKNVILYDSVTTTAASIFEVSDATTTVDCGIRDSKMYDCESGVVMHGANATNRPSRCYIENCEIYDLNGAAGNSCVEFYYVDNCAIRGNYLHGVSPGYMITGNSGTTSRMDIVGNLIDTDGASGIYDPIFISATPNINICNNVFIGDNNRRCVRLFNGSTDVNVYNNIAFGVNEFFDVDVASQSGFASDYNYLFNIDSQVGRWGATSCADLSAWQAASSQDANSSEADPKLSATDMPSLAAGSPCLGTGANWWTTGGNPTGWDDEPFSDVDCDIGAKQHTDATTHPFHPLNL